MGLGAVLLSPYSKRGGNNEHHSNQSIVNIVVKKLGKMLLDGGTCETCDSLAFQGSMKVTQVGQEVENIQGSGRYVHNNPLITCSFKQFFVCDVPSNCCVKE